MKIKRWLTRAVATLFAAFVVVVAANFAGPGWYQELLGWLQPAPRAVPPPRPIARPGPNGPSVSVTPMRPEGNDSSVSPTPLALILVRTERGRNSREGFAQIGVRARSPQTYSVGAVLANGARLTEIYEHYVVLERDGHSARLYLQGEAQTDARAQGLLTVGGTAEPATVIVNSHEDLTEYLRPSPVFIGSQLHGFALYPGRNSTPFSELGLQPGDVLTGIQGSPLADASDALATLRTLTEGAVLSVEVERQGIAQTLSLDGSILRRATLSAREVTSMTSTPTHEATSSVVLSNLLTRESRP